MPDMHSIFPGGILQEGQKVVLDDFGSFYIAVHSDGVDSPEKFDLKRHVRKPFSSGFSS